MIGNETIVYKCDHNVDMSNALPLGRQDARNTMALSNNVFPSSSAFERHFYQDLADTDEVATKTQPNITPFFTLRKSEEMQTILLIICAYLLILDILDR